MTRTSILRALVLSATLLAGTTAMAQTPTGGGMTPAPNAPMLTPAQRLERRLAHEQKALGLTDAQVAQLRTILQQDQAKIQADRAAMRAAQPGAAKQGARQQLAADGKSMRDQLKGVLTPDQLAKWKAQKLNQLDRRERRLEHRKQMLKK